MNVLIEMFDEAIDEVLDEVVVEERIDEIVVVIVSAVGAEAILVRVDAVVGGSLPGSLLAGSLSAGLLGCSLVEALGESEEADDISLLEVRSAGRFASSSLLDLPVSDIVGARSLASLMKNYFLR